jgi:hypothetical protein
VRPGGLTVRAMFVTYLLVIVTGLVVYSVIGLLHN